jgi:hypothetical protein
MAEGSEYDRFMSLFGYVKSKSEAEGPHGWIQWKGTNVCIDLQCECGAAPHFDGEFFYYFRCADCGKTYAVGQYVKLVEIPAEHMKAVDSSSCLHTLTDD